MGGLEGRLRRILLVPGRAAHLAVARIALFAFLIPASLSSEPVRMARLPDELQIMPTGAGWIYALVEPTPQGARVAAAVMVVAAVAAMVGWRARLAAAVWSVTAIWAYGIPNLFGKVDHNHHLLWFAALLAASRCGDALSVEAARRGAPEPAPHVRYGFPLRIWWLLLGVVYLFPGLAKVGNQGLGWASPANIQAHLHAKWTSVEPFIEPLVRIDQWPLAMAAMGLFTLVFELGFLWAVFTRWRHWAGAAGIAFHLGTFLIMDIGFASLLVCYVAVFVVPVRESTPVEMTGDVGALLRTVAIVLVGTTVAFGATQTEVAWPVAAYPGFGVRPGNARSVLEFEVVLGDGTSVTMTQDDVLRQVAQSRRRHVARRVLSLDERDLARALPRLGLPAFTRGRSVLVWEVIKPQDPDPPALELERTQVAQLDIPEATS